MLVLALFARPLVVLLTLGLARLSWAERAFIAWSGLKGRCRSCWPRSPCSRASPEPTRCTGSSSSSCSLSVATQGTLVPSVARALAIPMHERPALPWELSVRLGEEPPAAHEFEVAARSRVVGCAIRELPLGEHTWITLVVRDGAATRPGGSLELEAGDRVLLLADAGELEALARLFHASRLADT